MSYLELYDNEILDVISLGKFVSNFNEDLGDYIKVLLLEYNTDTTLATLYSNRILLKDELLDENYFGDYHFHPENSAMGFCTGKEHTAESKSKLRPIVSEFNTNLVAEALDPTANFKKQFDIYKDSNNRIYIKPNEIINNLKLTEEKYKIRIYFLRNIKSQLGLFLKSTKNNLIENGNFLAGLEPTQTGDLDRSVGRNNFIIRRNPGGGQYILEQDGVGDNIYNMRIAGIRPATRYIFSCWVAWNNSFNGSRDIVSFETLDVFGDNISLIINEGLLPQDKTDGMGSWVDDEIENIPNVWYNRPSRIISQKVINGVVWYKLFAKVTTTSDYKFGTININLGTLTEQQSTVLNGRRYFTDLKLESIEDFDTKLLDYINKGGGGQSTPEMNALELFSGEGY
jgi:hypothetical protein